MSISDREIESFNQKTHEIMESLKVSQKRLEEMIVTLKGPLGAARMNSNTEEIKNFTEIMDNLKKLQRSMIADSNCLSFIKDDLETAKDTSEANAKLREEERKSVDANKDVVDPRGTYRRQRKIEEARSNDESPRNEPSSDELDDSFGVEPPSDEGEGYDESTSDRERQYRKKVDETYQEKGKRPYQGKGKGPYQGKGKGPYQGKGKGPYQEKEKRPYQEKGKRPYQEKGKRPYQEKGKRPYQEKGKGPYQERRNEWNRNDERRQYRDEREDERRSGGRKYHQRQYEGDREDERRSGGGRRYQQRR
jgi:hypothetical protein